MAKSFRYLTQYPIDQSVFKFGYKQTDTTTADYQRYLKIESDKAKWLTKAVLHEKTALTVPESISTLHYSYRAMAMESCCRCMASYDEGIHQLTSHAFRFWRTFTWRKAIPAAPQITEAEINLPISGLIGSLASYAYCFPATPWGDSDVETIGQLIELFWLDLDIDLNLTPNERLLILLKNTGFNAEYIQKCIPGLTLLLTTHLQLKLELIDSALLPALPLRLLMGEVPDKFISIWARLQASCNANRVQQDLYSFEEYSYQLPFTQIQAGLTIARGGGWALVMQALYVEAILNIVNRLPANSIRTIDEFSSDPLLISTRLEIAHYFALAADAQTVLSLFGTIQGAKDLATAHWRSAQQWLDTTTEVALPTTSPYRLPIMTAFLN